MKLTVVCDAFMKEDYYRKATSLHPGFEIDNVFFFGVPDQKEMRGPIRKIEQEGPEAVPLPDGLMDVIGETEALMVHLCPVTRALIEKAKNLKIIMVNRGGTENIDVAAATEHNIPVLSNPAHNANAVAEHTIGLMLAESRNIARADAEMRKGLWREKFPNTDTGIFELKGLKVGVIGLSTIARIISKILSAFGCELYFSDPFVPADDPDAVQYGIKKVGLDELMATCDFVSLHARGNGVIVGAHELSLMKPTAYFINTARPHLVDYDALYEVLRDKKIMGAAIDVHRKEPTDPANPDPLFSLDNITLTNHRGGATVNSYSDSPEMMLTEADKLFAGKDRVRFFINKDKIKF